MGAFAMAILIFPIIAPLVFLEAAFGPGVSDTFFGALDWLSDTLKAMGVEDMLWKFNELMGIERNA
ncbi:MAG: hypothetical protein LBN05_08495 [Oscillospiraceae bacterium]|jgi:hypothetical protein|nr:hypothetical protein [Oscillospiraceae bacterium]